MPTKTIQIQDNNLSYALIAFDKNGQERTDDPEGLMSENILKTLSEEPITDVFIFSHGWLGDLDAAENQYDRWVKVMGEQTKDIEAFRQVDPEFRPLLIGVHWPSLPFGEENFNPSDSPTSFATPNINNVNPVEYLISFYSDNIADTETTQAALKTIIEYASQNSAPSQLPDEIKSAYQTLQQQANLTEVGVAGAPGTDGEPFDIERQYFLSQQQAFVSFGNPFKNAILAPLRTLSFWKMKDRARKFGESGGFELLRKLQQGTPSHVRFHLMGHSFGCIVVSATLCGPQGQTALLRPVNSVALVQGALSIWSYCEDIPYQTGTSGYFHPLIRDKRVNGPIITTISEHDTAVGNLYPLAAGVARQVSFKPQEKPPKYGALGRFGIHGEDLPLEILEMLPIDQNYAFSSQKIYNLNGNNFINQGSGLGGAHNDIDKPEVAHAIWSAAISSTKA